MDPVITFIKPNWLEMLMELASHSIYWNFISNILLAFIFHIKISNQFSLVLQRWGINCAPITCSSLSMQSEVSRWFDFPDTKLLHVLKIISDARWWAECLFSKCHPYPIILAVTHEVGTLWCFGWLLSLFEQWEFFPVSTSLFFFHLCLHNLPLFFCVCKQASLFVCVTCK